MVVSSGALSTPQILQRSGIELAIKLNEMGIKSVSDLPGVGTNYQDHQLMLAAVARVECSDDDTGDKILRGDAETHVRFGAEFAKERAHSRGISLTSE